MNKILGLAITIAFLLGITPAAAQNADTANKEGTSITIPSGPITPDEAEAKSEDIVEESNVYLPTGAVMGMKVIEGPENFRESWARMFYDLYRPDTGSYLGQSGGNFIKRTMILIDDLVRSDAAGASAFGKEAFISSGGKLEWSGGPYRILCVYSPYIAAKNNSVTFRGAIWWDDQNSSIW